MTMLYSNLCYDEACFKGPALYVKSTLDQPHTFVEIILSLDLFQIGQLSVTEKRMNMLSTNKPLRSPGTVL